MAAPAGWSELPKELLHLISQRLDIEIDLLRFRSVCSNWRSSSIPNHHHILPLKFPLFLNSIHNASFSNLSKQNFFLIKPPPQQQTQIRPWLIRISKNSTGKSQLFNPLLCHVPPYLFPHALDSDELSVVPLGNNFIKEYDFTENWNYIFPEKVVAVTCHGKKPIVLGTLLVNPQPLILKCGDENWKVVPDLSVYLGDICDFKGWPYAVERNGNTVRVGVDDSCDSSVQLVSEPLVDGGGFRKFLVESESELLLVDVYDCTHVGFADHVPLRIDLFKLDEKEKKWVKLTSLGDRVLFLGFVCSFTISILDLCVTKGNCVIFMDNILKWFTYFDAASCVFNLDEGRLSPLSDYPEYDVFLPPEWIVNS